MYIDINAISGTNGSKRTCAIPLRGLQELWGIRYTQVVKTVENYCKLQTASNFIVHHNF